MTKPILFNAFDMLVPTHQSPGLWRHPESQIEQFDTLNFWTQTAQTLEDAGFSALFLADIPGLYDVYGGNADATAKGGVQFPLLDPLVIVPALAAATKTLSFGVTASVTYEQPYLLARTFATLDHLTGGRVAWNIVTSYQDSAARNLGLDKQLPHDERYDRADEFMDVIYQLFEGSIAPGAVRADKESGVFVDPEGVREIGHRGTYFSVPGHALTHPGPQGTPFLFQAGASKRGQEFSIEHAEAVFFAGGTPALVRGWVDGLRSGLRAAGRPEDAIKAFALATIIVDETDEAAQARLEEYTRYVDVESALALFGGWTGVDLSGHAPDDVLEHVATESSQTALSVFTTQSDKQWTIRDLAEYVSIGGRGPVIVGSAQTVADELERWVAESGVDGFNVSAAVRPADFERFKTYLTPELERRGLLSRPEPGQTLRAHLAGASRAASASRPASARVAGGAEEGAGASGVGAAGTSASGDSGAARDLGAAGASAGRAGEDNPNLLPAHHRGARFRL